MESPGVSRIAAEEAWESEVLPASEAAPAPAESEVAPASPEGEAVPEPAEERPSMLSRLASWRAPEPEPEMEREGETEAPAPPQDEPRQLPCDHHHCRAPPGRLGLAFKDSTRVVGRVNATSALSDTVREGDELVLVNDCVVTDDDVLGILAAQDDGATGSPVAGATSGPCSPSRSPAGAGSFSLARAFDSRPRKTTTGRAAAPSAVLYVAAEAIKRVPAKEMEETIPFLIASTLQPGFQIENGHMSYNVINVFGGTIMVIWRFAIWR